MNKLEEHYKEMGFRVVGADEGSNKLLDFLRENFPNVIKDGEINLEELKVLAGVPVSEKVNGYGLNFVGRSYGRAKYRQATEKEVRLNEKLSRDAETTENMVIKGDNIDSLKILKNYYQDKIKCIYIDPPYNTQSDNFVYPDRFDKEEAEVLGFGEINEDDFERMDFSFKSKRSHNGWLSFMYPRLLLAKDLLKEDGVIFISIDDNEQANLKLLCDDIFGEENVDMMIWRKAGIGRDGKMKNTTTYRKDHEYILVIYKNIQLLNKSLEKPNWVNSYGNPDNDPRGSYKAGSISRKEDASNDKSDNYYSVVSPSGKKITRQFDFSKEYFDTLNNDNRIYWGKNGDAVPSIKIFEEEEREVNTSSIIFKEQNEFDNSLIEDNRMNTTSGSNELDNLLKGDGIGAEIRPKPSELIRKLVQISTNKDNADIILDFFAGSGTTGHAVMQLNAKDGGNRKFILCQIDEPIDKKKEGYKFCKERGLEAVISSITIERLRRAGDKIREENPLFVGDVGYKVFEHTNIPKLTEDEEGHIQMPTIFADVNRVYSMVFSVGVDEPCGKLEVIKENCIYKMGKSYYIINAERMSNEEFGKMMEERVNVYIDGWTASINTTLQQYKDREDFKVVF